MPPWDDDGRVLVRDPQRAWTLQLEFGSDVVKLGVKAESNSITKLVDDYGPTDDVGFLFACSRSSSHKHARVCLS